MHWFMLLLCHFKRRKMQNSSLRLYQFYILMYPFSDICDVQFLRQLCVHLVLIIVILCNVCNILSMTYCENKLIFGRKRCCCFYGIRYAFQFWWQAKHLADLTLPCHLSHTWILVIDSNIIISMYCCVTSQFCVSVLIISCLTVGEDTFRQANQKTKITKWKVSC